MASKSYYIALLACVLFAGLVNTYSVFGQKSALSDTISYQSITFCEKIESELLFEKVKNTIYQIYDSASISIVGNHIAEVNVQVKIYSQLLGKIGHPTGLLFFLYKIEVKDEKFRCLVDNFYFKPMERNRYGRFQQVKTDAELVCRDNFKSNPFLFKKIENQSEGYANKLTEKLKVEAITKTSAKIDW